VVPTELVGAQPTAGRFEERGADVWFLPRFAFRPGLRYSLLVDGVEAVSVELPVPVVEPTTSVIAIHPAARVVPENLLRLYVTFSAPMSEGWAARAVEIVDVEGVLLTEPELWDREHRRLTLLLEPGRIKRGLAPNAEAGPPLAEGESFTLRVDAAFRDAAGLPLITGTERTFEVGPAVRSRVDPSAWEVVPPHADTFDPLVVRFDRPLDHALATRYLDIGVDGEVTVVGEMEWSFRPREPWRAGRYELRVDAALEDLAGNSVRRVFDRDLERAEDDPRDVDVVSIPFAI
jgi:hypothetical protein